jgi:hypothetical protein
VGLNSALPVVGLEDETMEVGLFDGDGDRDELAEEVGCGTGGRGGGCCGKKTVDFFGAFDGAEVSKDDILGSLGSLDGEVETTLLW